MEFVPPANSKAAEAHRIMKQYFPSIEDSGMNLVFLETQDGSNIKGQYDQLVKFTEKLEEEVKKCDFIEKVIGITNFGDNELLTGEGSYLDYIFYSEDGTSTFIVVEANKNAEDYSSKKLKEVLEESIDVAREYASISNIQPAPIGMDVILQLCTDSTMSDLLVMDITVIPIAFIIFAIFLKSVRLLIIPLVQLIIILAVSFGISYFLTFSITVPPFTPSIQSAFCLALTVDYCLFLTSSFRKGISVGLPVVPSVRYMIASAGKVVVVSCLSVTLSVTSLMFYNVDIIRVCGYGTVISLLILLAVCITLVPCMIMVFPNFFSHFSFTKGKKVPLFYSDEECITSSTEKSDSGIHSTSSVINNSITIDRDELESKNRSKENSDKDNHDELTETVKDGNTSRTFSSSQSSLGLENSEEPLNPNKNKKKSFREKYSEFCRKIGKYPVVVINAFTKTKLISMAVVLCTVAVASPFAYFSLTLENSMDMNMVIPKDDNIVQKTNDFTEKFTTGLAFQSYLILTPKDGLDAYEKTIFDKDVFEAISEVTEKLSKELESENLLKKGNYVSINNIPGASYNSATGEREALKISWDFVNECMNGDGPTEPIDIGLCKVYKSFISSITNEEKSVAILFMSEVGIDCVGSDKLTDIMRAYSTDDKLSEVGIRGDVWGIVTDMNDCMNLINKMFPIITVVIVIIVFTIMSLAYNSLFTILRLILSIIITLSISFGIVVLIYQYSIRCDIFWALLPFGFCIMIGLSCDYDSFIYSFFKDFRNMGFTEQGSIRKAVYEVTPIINSAGLIMAVSFIGLLISHLTLLQQFGVLLFVGVIIETYWVRPFFVSSFINICRKIVHWPFAKKLPPEQFDENKEAATDYGVKFTSDGWSRKVKKGKGKIASIEISFEE